MTSKKNGNKKKENKGKEADHHIHPFCNVFSLAPKETRLKKKKKLPELSSSSDVSPV
jgi:hypothetical protein